MDSSPQGPYSYVWEFLVPPESEASFRDLYGPRGGWVRLFQRASGYLGTVLLADRQQPGRYVTIDRWRSEAAFRAFRERFGAEFAALDAQGGSLTSAETHLGSFEEVLASASSAVDPD